MSSAGRNDFLGKAYGGKTLCSFGVNPGAMSVSMILEREPITTFSADDEGARRLRIKQKPKQTRRGISVSAVFRTESRETGSSMNVVPLVCNDEKLDDDPTPRRYCLYRVYLPQLNCGSIALSSIHQLMTFSD
jgi:hypothetical protein